MRDAVIFDMDGLLLDTERISLAAYHETCADFGLGFDQTLYDSLIGCNMVHIEQMLTDKMDNFPGEPFMKMWQQIYHDEAVLKPVPVKEGVREFLEYLAVKNIPCAVATSTGYEKAKQKLKNAELLDFFKDLSTGDQVQYSKPHPEIYLKAARKIGFMPSECLAIEDSDNGVRAAHGAEMLVFQIPDLITPSKEVRKLGHIIVDSMKDVHQRFLD